MILASLTQLSVSTQAWPLTPNVQWMYATRHSHHKLCSFYCFRRVQSNQTLSEAQVMCTLQRESLQIPGSEERFWMFVTFKSRAGWNNNYVPCRRNVCLCCEFPSEKPSHFLMFKFLIENPREKNKTIEQQNLLLLIYINLIFESLGHDPPLLSPAWARGSL